MTYPVPSSRFPVAIIGAGIMGAGIAQVFAQVGHPVCLQARRRESLEAALARIHANQEGLVAYGLLTAEDAEAACRRIRVTQDPAEALVGAGFVSENIPEQLEAKQALFAEIDRLLPDPAILSTNTSSLPISKIAQATRTPGRVVGMHWFNPPHLIPLVEVIRGERTADSALDSTYTLARAIGKVPIRVERDIPGFVANRIQRALEREVFYLDRIGACTREDLEIALKQGLGFRWSVAGPYELADLAGIETFSAVASFLFPELSRDTEPPPLFAELVAKGRLGAKTGAGIYNYGPGDVDRILARRNAMLIDFIKILKQHPPLRAPMTA